MARKAKRKTGWQNRIVESGTADPEQLLANPKNWRIHPRYQQEALEGVLGKVGWVGRIIVNRRTGFVVDGHLRISLALRKGEKVVPVDYVDLDEDEEALILATYDPIASMAATESATQDAPHSRVGKALGPGPMARALPLCGYGNSR